MISLYQWLVLSSKDANKKSLFIKGVLTTIISFVLPIAVYLGFNFTHEQIDPIVNNITALVDLILQAVGVAMMIVGGIRKLWLTYKGQNHLEIK